MKRHMKVQKHVQLSLFLAAATLASTTCTLAGDDIDLTEFVEVKTEQYKDSELGFSLEYPYLLDCFSWFYGRN